MVILVCEESKTTSRLDINPIALGWFPPFRYGQGILMGIPHHIILSNIIGRWGGMLHVKHERLFAISWGLFHFHTSDTPTENCHFPNSLTTDKSHNHAIYKGWGGTYNSSWKHTI